MMLGLKLLVFLMLYGALYDPDGLDIDYLLDRRDSFGTVTTLFENRISNKEMLELRLRYFSSCCCENQITMKMHII